MSEIEVDGDTIAEVVAYLNGRKTVPAKRMADAVLRLLNRHYQDADALESARESLERETALKGGVEAQRDALWAELEAAREDGVMQRFADMLLGVLNDTQDALGFTDEQKLCPNGSIEIVAAIREFREDAERYRFIRDSTDCSLSISHNDHHNVYVTAEDTLDDPQGYYSDLPDGERERMIESDSIWTLHVYPDTPVGFNVYHAATLGAAIDQARGKGCGAGKGEGDRG